MAARQPSSSRNHAIEMPPVETVSRDPNWFDVHLAKPPEEGFSVAEEAKKEREKRRNKRKEEHTTLSLFTAEDAKESESGGDLESSTDSATTIKDKAGSGGGIEVTTTIVVVTETGDPKSQVRQRKNIKGDDVNDESNGNISHDGDESDEKWNKKAWSILNAENQGGTTSDLTQGKFDSPETFWGQGKLKRWDETNDLIINGKVREKGSGESVGGERSGEESNGDLEQGSSGEMENVKNLEEHEGGKQVVGGRRQSLKDEFFRDHKIGGGWNLDFLAERKRHAEESGDDVGSDNLIFQGFSTKSSCKKKRISRLLATEVDGIMTMFLRLREQRLARRRKKRSSYTWYLSQGSSGFITSVHIFFDLMHISCMSPYNRNRKPMEQQTRKKQVCINAQAITYSIFAVLSIWKSFTEVKRVTLIFLNKRGPEDLYDIGSYLATGCIVTYAHYFFIFQQDQIDEMLRHWEFYEACTTNLSSKELETKNKRTRFMVRVCFVGSIIFTILRAVFNSGFENWSFDDLFLQNGADLCAGLEIWTVRHQNNTAAIYEKYAAMDSFFFKYIVGFVGLAMRTINLAEMDAIRNLLILVAQVNDKHVWKFGQKAQETIASMLPFLSNAEKDLKCWRLYRLARRDNELTNETFDTMLKMNHTTNALLSAYLVTLCLDKKTNMIDVTFIAYELLKAIYMYVVARRTVKHNIATQNWIKSLPDDSQRFVVGNTPYSRLLMLYELALSPFGFGTGSFQISGKLIYTLLGGVASLVIVLLTFHYSGLGKEE